LISVSMLPLLVTTSRTTSKYFGTPDQSNL
jgi:hypothetical protein